jgi:glycosyltransferase involved in cell wall biosynthesis
MFFTFLDSRSRSMSGPRLRILQVSTADRAGGAEQVAWNLFTSFRARGHGSWLAVGTKKSTDKDVFCLPNDEGRSGWARTWLALGDAFSPFAGKVPGAATLRLRLKWVGQFRRLCRVLLGHEDFDFPGTRQLLRLPPERPDLLVCHNLHGGYFDLREMAEMSRQLPVVLMLHDAWLLSGHCAHSFACERWRTGCGRCPDLDIYPSIRRDATSANWARKRDIFAQSRLYVMTPCRWLMERVSQSLLAPAVIASRVIANGVPLEIFRPGDQYHARQMLGLPSAPRILLFAAFGVRKNPFKDYATLEEALGHVAARLAGEEVLFLCLGEKGSSLRIQGVEIRFVPFQEDPAQVALYYQASDLYVHASRADTFPTSILEALACGTPVVATAVGGITEQLRLGERATGILVPPGDADALAEAVVQLLRDDSLRRRSAENAADDARHRFDLERQVEECLDWYQEILASTDPLRTEGKVQESLGCPHSR